MWKQNNNHIHVHGAYMYIVHKSSIVGHMHSRWLFGRYPSNLVERSSKIGDVIESVSLMVNWLWPVKFELCIYAKQMYMNACTHTHTHTHTYTHTQALLLHNVNISPVITTLASTESHVGTKIPLTVSRTHFTATPIEIVIRITHCKLERHETCESNHLTTDTHVCKRVY